MHKQHGKGSEEDNMDILTKSGLWEFRQSAEDEFVEPANVLAASADLFDDDDDDDDGNLNVYGC